MIIVALDVSTNTGALRINQPAFTKHNIFIFSRVLEHTQLFRCVSSKGTAVILQQSLLSIKLTQTNTSQK